MTEEGKGGLREASGERHKGDDEGGEETKKLIGKIRVTEEEKGWRIKEVEWVSSRS